MKGARDLADALRRCFRDAIRSMDLADIVAQALPPLPPKSAEVHVIAAGKASISMARGARARWRERIASTLVIAPEGADATGLEGVDVRRAAHPIPDERSVAAAEAALAVASGLRSRDLLVVLISGGASALLAAPPEGTPLAEKRALVAALLARGAPIRAVNTVRRHASRIKGGRLAAAAGSARVLTLIASDVIGGEAHDIGSGPSVLDPTTIEDAQAIIAACAPDLAAHVPMSESLKPSMGASPPSFASARSAPGYGGASPSSFASARLRWKIIVDPAGLAARIAERIERETELRARVLPGEEGSATEIARRRVEQARGLAPGEAIVVPCEPTLAIPEDACSGGRAGYVALMAAADLPRNVAFLCGATDGVDGTSGGAGAVVTREDAAVQTRLTRDEALARFDDATWHREAGTRIEGGPTGLNFTDVHVLARAR